MQRALQVDSSFVPAYLNLADLLRAEGREAEGEQLLRQAIARGDDSGAARHALGLTLVRQARADEALAELAAAVEAAPQNARFSYVYGVALHSSGQVATAFTVLGAALDAHPYDVAILTALLSFHRDAGQLEEAIEYAETWVAISPGDSQAAEALVDLMRRRGR